MNATAKFLRALRKHFDIEFKSEFDPNIVGSNETGKEVDYIWIYEKGEDCEPVLILKDAWWYTENNKSEDFGCWWIVGNVYSTLEHGSRIHNDEFMKLVKANKIVKR
jgi:hypothetical protein